MLVEGYLEVLVSAFKFLAIITFVLIQSNLVFGVTQALKLADFDISNQDTLLTKIAQCQVSERIVRIQNDRDSKENYRAILNEMISHNRTSSVEINEIFYFSKHVNSGAREVALGAGLIISALGAIFTGSPGGAVPGILLVFMSDELLKLEIKSAHLHSKSLEMSMVALKTKPCDLDQIYFEISEIRQAIKAELGDFWYSTKNSLSFGGRAVELMKRMRLLNEAEANLLKIQLEQVSEQ